MSRRLDLDQYEVNRVYRLKSLVADTRSLGIVLHFNMHLGGPAAPAQWFSGLVPVRLGNSRPPR